MQFQFESNQQFQLDAIESIVNLFEGQHHTSGQIELKSEGLAAIPNRLDMHHDGILRNLRQVQEDNDLPVDKELQCIEANISLLGEETNICFPNFSVEMETGTGKTYVYLRTVLELFRRYGLRKLRVLP